MNTLPAEVSQLIWRNVYNSVIKEIRDFIIVRRSNYAEIYMYKKPNALNKENVYFTIHPSKCRFAKYKDPKYVFQSTEKYGFGGRQVHWLQFYEAILFMKIHPTGRHKYYDILIGYQEYVIEHERYDSDSSDEEVYDSDE